MIFTLCIIAITSVTKAEIYFAIADPQCQGEKEKMYLLTQSETLATGVTVTFTAGSDTGNIIDSDLTTSAETANRTPNLTIDLGARKVIDALYLKGENLHDYDLKASNNNITYTDIYTGVTVPAHGNSFITFTNTTAYRYWRLAFSQRGASDPNYRVAEVFLMRLLLDLNTDELRPLHYRPSIPRDGVVAYDTYNGNVVQYNTEDAEKTTLTFQWESLDNDVADALERLWKGPPHAPTLTVYARPNAEPGDIYIAKWASEFGFQFERRFRRGQAVFEET